MESDRSKLQLYVLLLNQEAFCGMCMKCISLSASSGVIRIQIPFEDRKSNLDTTTGQLIIACCKDASNHDGKRKGKQDRTIVRLTSRALTISASIGASI